jgi:biotin synthase
MNIEYIQDIYNKPLFELITEASKITKDNFDLSMELCTLKSIKTGSCPEDCKYCPQSGHYNTGLVKEKLLDKDTILKDAIEAKKCGSKRFCMGAAWKNIPKNKFDDVIDIIKSVKDIGIETCATLGNIDKEEAEKLSKAGLDYYNHNLDTSRKYYKEIITTRTYDERISTITNIADAGINICCGGILGMGEEVEDRLNLLREISMLPKTPKSIPINTLIPVKGTPLGDKFSSPQIDTLELARFISTTRIMFPNTVIRLSAGRENMSTEAQTLCFLSGVNSIFYGSKLLTKNNSDQDYDLNLISSLGLKIAK